jgi:hypothetical protein
MSFGSSTETILISRSENFGRHCTIFVDSFATKLIRLVTKRTAIKIGKLKTLNSKESLKQSHISVK